MLITEILWIKVAWWQVKEKNMFKEIDFKDLGERCIATFLETFLAMITAQAMTGGDNDLLAVCFCRWSC